jgi:hypothetical protein
VGVGYDGTFTILAVPSATTFTYNDPTSGLTNASGGTATSAAVINLPNTLAQGIPIGLTAGAGVTSGSLTFIYDPTLLTITGFTPTAAVTVGSFSATSTSNITASGASETDSTVTITTTAAHNLVVGQVVQIAGVGVSGYDGTFTVTSVTSTTFTVTNPTTGLAASGNGTVTAGTVTLSFTASGLAAGVTRLGGLVASVPTTAPYKAKDFLHFTSTSLDGGAINSTGSDALHVVTYFGDGDASGAPNTSATYTGNDVTLAGRVGTGADTGFAAFRLVDPVIIADVTNDGRVNTNDGSTLNAEIGAPQQTIPLVPSLTGLTTAGPDPTISIPKGLTVTAGGTLTVPVLIDDPRPAGSTGMTQAILALRYDPSVFTVSASDVSLGSVPLSSTGWKLEASVDQASGQIGVTIYAAGGVAIASSAGGSLVTVKLHAKSGAVNGTSPVNLAAEVTLPGRGVVRTQIDDDQGAMVLTPAPTDASTDKVDGTVIVSGGVTPPQTVTFGVVASSPKMATTAALAAALRQSPTSTGSQPPALPAPTTLPGNQQTLWGAQAPAGGGVPDTDVAKMLTKAAPANLSAIDQALAQGADNQLLPKTVTPSRTTRKP